jgi:hypothetical protein
MSYKRLIKLVEKYAAEAGDWAQILSTFQQQFHKGLRAITGELAGDIAVLKERQLDDKPLKALAKIHQDLVEIIKTIDPQNPYASANKLAHLTSSGAIDRLNEVAKQHLQDTNIEFKTFPSAVLKHPEMHSLDKLKTLVVHLQDFMAKHPVPTQSGLAKNLEGVPAFTSGEWEATKY